MSHTDGLIDISKKIMEKNGVSVETIRFVDHDIATGVYPDMTEHGWETDEWPKIFKKVNHIDIFSYDSEISSIGEPFVIARNAAFSLSPSLNVTN